ncbi:hypothetical protein [Mariniflexile sp. AS56]|uniref:hypothetical protein n=1 Tax=Mariniflexile sp. AS56 TaxID=3063957 RepID=UPI0026F2A905|nr:hypothetical protein [Mariniflexile sp. AS56]MDO7173629.1 hypothetical protein [Mariniflexile sp. AS56]
MKTKHLLLSAALSIASLCQAQNTITVDNSVGSNAQYSNLQSAISAASSGDVIYIHPSEINYGNVNIDKEITLIGYSHLGTEKQTLVTDIVLLNNASNSKFSGLHLTDDFYTNNTNVLSGIIVENCYIKSTMTFNSAGVDDIIIRGNIIYQIGTSGLSSTSNNFTNAIISNNIILYYIGLKNHQSVTIKNNIFLGPYPAFAINNANDTTGSITVQNNIFYYNTNSNFDPNSAGVVFENCLSYNMGSGSITALAGTNNINDQNPQFVESNNNSLYEAEMDDYHLQAGSLAIGSGAGGVDMGLYDGSPFVFNNLGYTNGIPTVKITNITDRIAPGANLSVTINTNAN